jgi:hypothetical protein
MKVFFILSIVVFTIFLFGCNEDEITLKEGHCNTNKDCNDMTKPICDNNKCVEENVSILTKVDTYTLNGSRNIVVDILFVVDNSGSMAEEQEKVAQNIENFMKKIKTSAAEGKTQYHIGVITTSVWDINQTANTDIKNNEDGRLQAIQTTSDCLHPSTNKRFLQNSDNNDVVDQLKNTIKCLGIGGSGIERGFDAIVKALSDERLHNENSGFLRDDAKLMIIVIGDEDDCSTGLRAYDPTTGLAIENDPTFTNFPISKARGRDCVEQSDLIAEATQVVTNPNEENMQNKLKPINEYYDFLLSKKDGNSALVGFATIVGPLNCWTGEISDMGEGAQKDSSVPFAFQNCRYSSQRLTSNYEDNNQIYIQNFGFCQDGVTQACTCPETMPTIGEEPPFGECNMSDDLFTSCFNNSAGTPNKIPIISENECSEAYLNGKCDDGKHCEITGIGVKCVDNTCSATLLNGTCPANQYCNNGTCEDKIPATYAQKDSYATPGRRYLEMQKLVEENNSKDAYKYSICLEDFGTPLSLIGSKLADSKCEYDLISKTDMPCSVIIKIFAPDDTELKNGTTTSLNSPWIYVPNAENTDKTGDELYRICKENLDKSYSERIDITQYLEKVPCGENSDGSLECLKILFPEELGGCPKAGSQIEVYYGVIGK